jgi:hypothetical protein
MEVHENLSSDNLLISAGIWLYKYPMSNILFAVALTSLLNAWR